MLLACSMSSPHCSHLVQLLPLPEETTRVPQSSRLSCPPATRNVPRKFLRQ